MGMIQAPNQTRTERLEQMIRLYEKDMLRICCLYLRDWSLAEDIVQEAFLKAYRGMDAFLGQCSEKTWLIKIVMNCCRDYRRSSWYRFIDKRVSLDTLPAAEPPPSDEHIALTMAVMRLRPKYLEAVLLYFYEGYSMKEIAEMLGITEAAVSSRISRAKQKLKRELEGDESDENGFGHHE